jgi:hypothetical protein
MEYAMYQEHLMRSRELRKDLMTDAIGGALVKDKPADAAPKAKPARQQWIKSINWRRTWGGLKLRTA